MEQWIPFQDGEYLVEQAFLEGSGHRAVPVEKAVIEISTDPAGMRQLKGFGTVRNVRVVELLEETEEIDLVLDLGQDFMFRLIRPSLKAGKVFDPVVKSLLQFVPTSPWIEIPPGAFHDLVATLEWLD